MNTITITIEGGPLATGARLPRCLQVFGSEGPDTVNRPDFVDRTIVKASYVLTDGDVPTYRHVPLRTAENGLCPPGL